MHVVPPTRPGPGGQINQATQALIASQQAQLQAHLDKQARAGSDTSKVGTDEDTSEEEAPKKRRRGKKAESKKGKKKQEKTGVAKEAVGAIGPLIENALECRTV